MTQIVKEIQLDRNMCDPNSYCFLSIEFPIQEIENAENFQSEKYFGLTKLNFSNVWFMYQEDTFQISHQKMPGASF